MRLVLENQHGKAVRLFVVEGNTAQVISRADTNRVEIHSDLERLDSEKIPYELLGQIERQAITGAPFKVGKNGQLRMVTEVRETINDLRFETESHKPWYVSLAVICALQTAFLALLWSLPENNPKLEQELKQQVVQIVKKIPPKQIKTNPMAPQIVANVREPKVSQRTTKAVNVRRLGALATLGSLKSGPQKGGLNLGAVNTTAGPGLGGTAGSGGVQSTLYGKGLVAAPVGAGANLSGGGGYGTKGKGGGQAGYGKLSLIGSAGTASIPLGKEALIEGGLDGDLIADVVNRNMGQVRFCYEQGLQSDPALAGRVAIRFIIGSSGQVKLADIESTTLNSKTVEECIVMRLRSWKFPLPEGGVDVKVSYPFMLRRAGQG